VLAVASWLMLKAIYFEVKSASAGTRQGGVLGQTETREIMLAADSPKPKPMAVG
jgi:hypothetical protein